MYLEKLLNRKNEYTTILSEVNRKLCFAGIAIIWLFRITQGDTTTIPNEMVFPLILLIISLFADFIQYFFSSFVWTVFYRVKELLVNEEKIVDGEFNAPYGFAVFSYIFLFGKSIITMVAYGFLLYFLSEKLIG